MNIVLHENVLVASLMWFLQVLLDAGANVNQKDFFDWMPLHVASKHGQTKVAEVSRNTFGFILTMRLSDRFL